MRVSDLLGFEALYDKDSFSSRGGPMATGEDFFRSSFGMEKRLVPLKSLQHPESKVAHSGRADRDALGSGSMNLGTLSRSQ